MRDGMGLPGGTNRKIERAGINAARVLFDSADLPFLEVPNELDVGKDAYVDFSEGGVFVGDLVALQIKSGESYRRGEDFKVPCDAKHRALWKGSSIPIYGLVHDPKTNLLHWADLSTWARSLRDDETPSFCPVERANVLDAETLASWTIQVRRQVRAQVSPPVFDLFSPDPGRQLAAVYDCLASGRTDPRPLKLLRASLRWLSDDPEVTWQAIQILSLMVGNPDMLWTKETWIPNEITNDVAATFRWSSEEVAMLMAAPTGDMWQRGDLGMGVFLVLKADPNCEQLLEQFVASTTDDELAWYATLLRVYLAGEEGPTALDLLVESRPTLTNSTAFPDLAATLTDHGYISLF